MQKLLDWNKWNSVSSIDAKSFVCGHCGDNTGSTHGYYYNDGTKNVRMYICTSCGHPTYFNHYEQYQIPGKTVGREINNLPEDIGLVYGEICRSIKERNYTASVLLARKLIMHLAIDVAQANEGESFVSYVDHLQKSGYVPPKSTGWLKKIKDSGNEKNHELKLATETEAISHQSFLEMLLVFMYEYVDKVDTGDAA